MKSPAARSVDTFLNSCADDNCNRKETIRKRREKISVNGYCRFFPKNLIINYYLLTQRDQYGRKSRTKKS